MFIRGTEIKRNEVNVETTMPELWAAVVNAIKKKHGIKPWWFLKADGCFYEEQEHYHGSIGDKKIRAATTEELLVMDLIKDMKDTCHLEDAEYWYEGQPSGEEQVGDDD